MCPIIHCAHQRFQLLNRLNIIVPSFTLIISSEFPIIYCVHSHSSPFLRLIIEIEIELLLIQGGFDHFAEL